MTRAGERLIKAAEKERDRLKRQEKALDELARLGQEWDKS